jgi:hypothetical protein
VPTDYPVGVVGPIGQERGRSRARRPSPLAQLRGAQSDQAVVKHALDLFRIAFNARQQLSTEWTRQYDWARGQQWEDQRRPSWRSRAKSNYLFANLFSKTALVTDSRPLVRAIPRQPADLPVVTSVINPTLAYLWDRNAMDTGFMETMAGALTIGTWFMKPYWDPSATNGLGEVQTDWVPAWFVWPDPGAVRVNGPGSGEFMFHAEPRSLEEINRLFPHSANRVEPEDIPYDFFSAPNTGRTADPRIVDRKTLVGVIANAFGGFLPRKQPAEGYQDIDRALCFELWVKDDTVEEREVEDESGKRKIVQARYPHGRHIVFANGVLLSDGDAPTDSGKFPFVKVKDYLWPGAYWGGGEMEQTIDIQLELNMQRARISDHMNYFTNGQWIIDKGATVEGSHLSNRPGQIVWKKPGTEARRETGLPLPAGMIDYLRVLQADMENIGGNTDVNQGRVPDRISSGLAIQEVKEAAQNRIRLTERLAKESLEELAEFWIEIAATYYEVPRRVRIENEFGEPSFVFVRPSQLKRGYDYEATVGSQLLKGQRSYSVAEALALHDRGAIDFEALLEVIDFPQRKDVMARMRGKKEQLLQMVKTDPEFADALIDALKGSGGPRGGNEPEPGGREGSQMQVVEGGA